MSRPANDPSSAPSRQVVDFWTERHNLPDAGAHDNFLSHPLVAGYISLRALGALISQMEALVNQIRDRSASGARIFSPGCGRADKEMILAAAFPDREFVAMDLTPEILEQARAESARRGLANLSFYQGDFNRLELEPRSFDVVVGMGSIHHVEALEHFWSEVRAALRPGGVVLAQEYVGPNRLQWTEAQVREGTRVLRELVADEHKPDHAEVRPVPLEVIIAGDPSEAVRSRDILPTCQASGFSILGYAGAGCALLQPVLMNQVHTYEPKNWEHNHRLATLFREEDRLMKAGLLGDDFAMFVASPR